MESLFPSLVISKPAILSNYHTCKKLVAKKTSIWPVVKANGYGCGAKNLIEILNDEPQLGGYFVAWLKEAIEISDLSNKPIAVLHGYQNIDKKNISKNIIPVLNTVESIYDWGKQNSELQSQNFVMLQIDTGMNRIGLNAKDINEISKSSKLKNCLKNLNVICVMTHYSDVVPDFSINSKQLKKFNSLMKLLPLSNAIYDKSLSASMGVFLPSKYHGEIVRLGISLYGGIANNQTSETSFQPVVNLTAKVLKLNNVSVGQGVGYGSMWKAKVPSIIATLGIGYADGIKRNLPRTLKAYYNGIACNIVGIISMDSMAIDITRLVKSCNISNITIGSTFSLINSIQDINVFARKANTIPYEVLTSISYRVERKLQNNQLKY